MSRHVLVVGGNEDLRHTLEFLLPDVRVKLAEAPADTEGLDVDVVVIAGPHGLSDLNEVKVYPMLYATPVVLVLPGQSLADHDWHGMDVWPITDGGFGVVDEVTEHVARLLARMGHPSLGRPLVVEGVRSAS